MSTTVTQGARHSSSPLYVLYKTPTFPKATAYMVAAKALESLINNIEEYPTTSSIQEKAQQLGVRQLSNEESDLAIGLIHKYIYAQQNLPFPISYDEAFKAIQSATNVTTITADEAQRSYELQRNNLTLERTAYCIANLFEAHQQVLPQALPDQQSMSAESEEAISILKNQKNILPTVHNLRTIAQSTFSGSISDQVIQRAQQRIFIKRPLFIQFLTILQQQALHLPIVLPAQNESNH